jgi:hypothetical protein
LIATASRIMSSVKLSISTDFAPAASASSSSAIDSTSIWIDASVPAPARLPWPP